MIEVFVGEWNPGQMKGLLRQSLLFDLSTTLMEALALDVCDLRGQVFIIASKSPVQKIIKVTTEVCDFARKHPRYAIGIYTNNADVLHTLAYRLDVCELLDSVTLNREDNTSLTLSGEDFSRAYRVGAVDIRRL